MSSVCTVVASAPLQEREGLHRRAAGLPQGADRHPPQAWRRSCFMDDCPPPAGTTYQGSLGMNDPGYTSESTALLVVDPYNDFLSEGGKLWPRTKAVAEQVGLLDHMRQVLAAARASRLRIMFVPHPGGLPRATTTRGRTCPPRRRQRARGRSSPRVHGAGSSTRTSSRARENFACTNTGPPAASPTLTWTFC